MARRSGSQCAAKWLSRTRPQAAERERELPGAEPRGGREVEEEEMKLSSSSTAVQLLAAYRPNCCLSMADQALDSPTLAFLSRLPLLLSPRPRLSSAAAHQLAAATHGPHSGKTGIQCRACRAELVGGVNASVWVERGELRSACAGCGMVSRRATEAAGSATATAQGKGAFEPAKKRRRVALQRRDEAVHPTALAASSTRPAHVLSASSRRAAGSGVLHGRAGRLGPDAAATSALPLPTAATSTSTSRLHTPAAAPTSSRPTPTSAAAPAHPLAPPLAPSRPPSTSSTARSTPSLLSTSASPAPARAAASPAPQAADAPTKKRKRAKQPSGLGELLEAKKKREQAERAAGGLGLAGFLQRL